MSAPASVLSDGTIRRLVEEGRVVIDPWDPGMVQPASVDLRLGPSFRVFHNHRAAAIDLRDPPTNLTEEVVIAGDEPFVIHPGEFALGRTQEYVEIPDDLVSRIEGKSSLGRLGLIVHATAGFVDPGFKGTLTLEITNLTRVPIKLYEGLPDRAALVHDARRARGAPVRLPRAGLALPGPDGRDGVALRPRGAVASRPMLLSTLATFTAFAQEVVEEEESEPVAFYILGGVAAAVGDHALPDRHERAEVPRQRRRAAGRDADQRPRRRGRDGERRALQLEPRGRRRPAGAMMEAWEPRSRARTAVG